MKHFVQIYFTLLIGISLPVVAQEKISVQENCLSKKYHDKCFFASKSVFDDYIYLKSRPFSKSMSGIRFTLNLKMNNLYLFNICEGSASKVVLNIYDAGNENLIIASTYDAVNKRHNRMLSFYTRTSGQYLVSVFFEGAAIDCCVVVCGMIRKNIDHYITIPE